MLSVAYVATAKQDKHGDTEDTEKNFKPQMLSSSAALSGSLRLK